MNGPDLLLGSLPERSADPVKVIEIVQNSRSVHKKIILAVVNEYFGSGLEDGNQVPNITTTDVRGKMFIDMVIL